MGKYEGSIDKTFYEVVTWALYTVSEPSKQRRCARLRRLKQIRHQRRLYAIELLRTDFLCQDKLRKIKTFVQGAAQMCACGLVTYGPSIPRLAPFRRP